MDQYKLKLNKTIIPCIPFLWYREQELLCPIEYTGICNKEKLNLQYLEDDLFVVVQRNVLDDANIYICLHSLLYYHLHNESINNNEIKKIPNNYAINKNFDVKIIPIDTDIIPISNGLKVNEYVSGSVFIHGCAFSPAGCLHFKIGKESKINKLLMFIKCEELNISIKCFFILINDIQDKNIDEDVKIMLSNII